MDGRKPQRQMDGRKRQRQRQTPQKGGKKWNILYNRTMKSPKEKELEKTIVALSKEIAVLHETIKKNYTMNYKITTFEKTIKKQNTIIADQNEKLKDQLSINKFMYQEVIQKDAEITRKDAEITQKDATLKILHSQLEKQFTEIKELQDNLIYERNSNEQLSKQLCRHLETSPSASRKHNGITHSPLKYRI